MKFLNIFLKKKEGKRKEFFDKGVRSFTDQVNPNTLSENYKEQELLTLENVVEKGLLTKEEMLRIKKDRAIKEWENEAKSKGIEMEKRSHHKQK